MNGFPSRETTLRVRATYPQGTRIQITHLDDPYSSLKAGDKGTVDHVDNSASLHCFFDNGSYLGLLYGIDGYKKIDE